MKGFLNKVVNGKPNGGGAVGGKPSGAELYYHINNYNFKTVKSTTQTVVNQALPHMQKGTWQQCAPLIQLLELIYPCQEEESVGRQYSKYIEGVPITTFVNIFSSRSSLSKSSKMQSIKELPLLSETPMLKREVSYIDFF